MKLIYSYVQETASSAVQNIDIPIDLTTYKYLQLNVFYEANSSTEDATAIYVLNSSKGLISCRLCGIHANNSTSLTVINNDIPYLVAAGTAKDLCTGIDVLIQCGNNTNYPIAFCKGFGGNQTWQDIKARILNNPPNVKYLRVPLYYAKEGGRILLWGIKGEDMGI